MILIGSLGVFFYNYFLLLGTARLKAQTAFVINELWPALIILFFLLDSERKDESGKYSGDCQSGIFDSVCVVDSDTFCSGRKDYRVFCSGVATDRDKHYYTDGSK